MRLNLKATKPVRFELVDDESETIITVSPEDDQETICRKLRKVLSLAEPELAPQTAREKIGLDMPKYMETTTVGQPANGWKRYEAPQVPDRLKGDVELIEEGE